MAWNVLTAPNAFDNAAWTKQVNCQITADQATDPGGVTQDADKYVLGGSSARAFGQKYTPGAAPDGQTWTFSIWVKGEAVGGTARTFLMEVDDATTPPGAGRTNWTSGSVTIPADGKWHSYEMTHTFEAGSNTAISAHAYIVAGAGVTVHIAWARLKRDGFHHPIRRCLAA